MKQKQIIAYALAYVRAETSKVTDNKIKVLKAIENKENGETVKLSFTELRNKHTEIREERKELKEKEAELMVELMHAEQEENQTEEAAEDVKAAEAELEKVKEEQTATATVEPKGKKFLYTVTFPDGTMETSLRTKDTYKYVQILKTEQTGYMAPGMNKRKDLAVNALNQTTGRQKRFGRIIEDKMVVEIKAV